MELVLVIGPLGAGKTTISRKLLELSGIPHIELDKLRLRKNGDAIPAEEWKKIEEELLAQDRWIFEGARVADLAEQLARADTVIVVHIARHRSFFQFVKREFFNWEQWIKWRWRALWVAWSFASLAMPRVWAIVEVNREKYGYKIVHLASHDMIAGYLERIEKEYTR